eukprot:gene25768-43649_t
MRAFRLPLPLLSLLPTTAAGGGTFCGRDDGMVDLWQPDG